MRFWIAVQEALPPLSRQALGAQADEIRKHKWIEGEKGRSLFWEQARAEWTTAHREKYEKFLIEALSFPEATAVTEPFAEEERVFEVGDRLSKLPHRAGG